jgi:LysM repeat protein
MRTWTKSACVVLAWSILPIILVAVGMKTAAHPAQANTRTAGSTEVILTSMLNVAAAPVTATSHTTRYVVQYGDTLSSIAARLAVRGGWRALYAANRQAIGPDPNVIHSGTVLVLPGLRPPVRYPIAAGDTLSGIAAEFAVRGGWRALYAANRQAIGPDPNVIHSGAVLTIPRSAAPSPLTAGQAHRRHHPPAPPPAPSAGPRHHPRPVTKGVSAASGMPQWLKTMLLAVGLLILVAFLTEPVLVVRRRRRRAAVQALPSGGADSTLAPGWGGGPALRSGPAGSALGPDWGGPALRADKVGAALRSGQASFALAPGWGGPTLPSGMAGAALPLSMAGLGRGRAPWRTGAEKAHIILADHDRLVVTRNKRDDTVYVLRPPGEDPKAILRVARLVLPEGQYGELAKRLGMPAIGPLE